MAGTVSNYNFGGEGVNLVKNPLELADGEALRLQNAELVNDGTKGGKGSLTKRGGLAVLNASALAGAILGMLGLNLKTTYVRTLYAARGVETANTWLTSLNGTAWTNIATPLAAAGEDKFSDANGERDARRVTSFKQSIIYPGNAYTKGTDNPPVALWDGTNAYTVAAIPVGPSATALTPAFAITDWITVNGRVFLAVHDPGGAAPALAGRVLELDLETGKISQIANAFGSGTGEKTGGYPCCLAWYQNQLWAGLQGNTTTDAIGTVVRCYPDIDTAWTNDVANLSGFPCSLTVFKGDLYAGTESSTATGARVYGRAATTKLWTARFTSAGGAGGNGELQSLTVYLDEIYAVEYFATTPIIHIIKSSTGAAASFTTDRDVDSLDGGIAGNLPASTTQLDLALYFVFRATTTTATNGFIMQKLAGVWTKVLAATNLAGPLVVLVERT